MSIAIIVATHGKAAKELLKTTEMILGEQENVSSIDFVSGENADTLEQKYKKQLTSLDRSNGLLFLVDMWGGSPFNAASAVVNKEKQAAIVTGVNVPMLIEVFMARDDHPDIEKLVVIAQEAGQTAVKVFPDRFSTVEREGSVKHQSTPSVVTSTRTEGTSDGAKGHLVIKLARIDDRLIHGQVATRWTKETDVKRIVVVNDDVVKDEVRTTLLKQAAPPGVTAHVVGVDKMARVYDNPKYAGEPMMLLFTNPEDVLRLVEKGVDIQSINIGGMAYKRGKKQVADAVSIDEKDIAAFHQLNKKGIELEFRKVASDSRVNMMDLIKKAST